MWEMDIFGHKLLLVFACSFGVLRGWPPEKEVN